MELFISHTTATDDWIKAHHYLHSAPAGARVRMEFYISCAEMHQLVHETGIRMDLDGLDDKYLIGAMMWGRPTSRKVDQKQYSNLHGVVSWILCPKIRRAMDWQRPEAWIRKNLPEIKY